MRIGIVQVKPVKGDIEHNIKNHKEWISKGIEKDVDLIVFPELSLTGYEPELAEELATNQNDKRFDDLQTLSDCNGITIAVGLPTREGENLFVSMIIFQPEKKRISYSKQYLFPTETPFFTAAKNPLTLNFETEVVAPAICYELSNKEHVEYAVKNNASIYLASVLNSIGGVDADLKKLSDIAKNHNMTTFMANYVGQSGGYDCAGKSSIWNNKGELIGQLDDRNEGLLVYDTLTEEMIRLD